jgi:hypothetical protein
MRSLNDPRPLASNGANRHTREPLRVQPTIRHQKRDLRDPSPALLDECNGLRTRSLNDARQGSLPTVLLHLESGVRLFGNQALTVKPVTPLSAPAARHPYQGADRRIRHHPPTNSDSCSTG